MQNRDHSTQYPIDLGFQETFCKRKNYIYHSRNLSQELGQIFLIMLFTYFRLIFETIYNIRPDTSLKTFLENLSQIGLLFITYKIVAIHELKLS